MDMRYASDDERRKSEERNKKPTQEEYLNSYNSQDEFQKQMIGVSKNILGKYGENNSTFDTLSDIVNVYEITRDNKEEDWMISIAEDQFISQSTAYFKAAGSEEIFKGLTGEMLASYIEPTFKVGKASLDIYNKDYSNLYNPDIDNDGEVSNYEQYQLDIASQDKKHDDIIDQTVIPVASAMAGGHSILVENTMLLDQNVARKDRFEEDQLSLGNDLRYTVHRYLRMDDEIGGSKFAHSTYGPTEEIIDRGYEIQKSLNLSNRETEEVMAIFTSNFEINAVVRELSIFEEIAKKNKNVSPVDIAEKIVAHKENLKILINQNNAQKIVESRESIKRRAGLSNKSSSVKSEVEMYETEIFIEENHSYEKNNHISEMSSSNETQEKTNQKLEKRYDDPLQDFEFTYQRILNRLAKDLSASQLTQ